MAAVRAFDSGDLYNYSRSPELDGVYEAVDAGGIQRAGREDAVAACAAPQ